MRDVLAVERQRKARAQEQEADLIEAEEDMYNVLATPEGRRFCRRLLADCGVYRSSFNTNALAMAFSEGERNVGLMLQARLAKAAPKFFQLMLEEGGDNAKQP